MFLTFRENSFTAGTIEISEGQTLIDSGPYAVVRHPMYTSAVILSTGVPLALGSWWGLTAAALLVPVTIWRLTRQEALVAAQLPGYNDDRRRVQSRLVPVVW